MRRLWKKLFGPKSINVYSVKDGTITSYRLQDVVPVSCNVGGCDCTYEIGNDWQVGNDLIRVRPVKVVKA